MQDPITMIGTDGIPGFGAGKVHPRMVGTFPRILGRYVREQGVIQLGEAVRKMTSLPAQTFGLPQGNFTRWFGCRHRHIQSENNYRSVNL